MSDELYREMTKPSLANKAQAGFFFGAMGCIAAPFVLFAVAFLIAMIANAFS